jgi:CBS domain-containing protein
MMYLFVSDLMRIRHGNVLPDSASLREAAERLIVSDCDVLVVTDGDRSLTGLVSESCVVRALLSGIHESTEIRSIVAHHTPSVRPDASLTCVLPMFRSAAVTALPVVAESGDICGLLLRRDVIAALVRSRTVIAEERERGICRESFATAGINRTCGSHEALSETVSGAYAWGVESEEVNPAAGVSRWSAADLSGPHFLNGAAARKALRPAEDRL